MVDAGRKELKATHYQRLVHQAVDRYLTETGASEFDVEEFTAWAVKNKILDLPIVNAFRQLRRNVSRAISKRYIEDDDGQPVRAMLAVPGPKEQKYLWSPIEKMTPERMKTAVQLIRNGARQTVFHADRVVRHFNKHVNPGDPLEFDWDFNKDIAESRLPLEYPDMPPEGHDEED